jgi:leucyl aminopeptidase
MFRDESGQGDAAMIVVFGFLAIALVAALFGLGFTYKAYSRYQKRADAENSVKVTAIQIKNQEQRVKIAKQKAEIRYQEAIGIRRAQDEIAQTLNPYYLTHEYIQALRESNANTVYIPTNPSTGLPVVTTRNAGGNEAGR